MARGPRYQQATERYQTIFTILAIGFNPTQHDWNISSIRNVRNRSLYLDGERHPIQEGGGGTSVAPIYDPTFQQWTIPSYRGPSRKYWTDTWNGNDWLNPTITSAFDPSQQTWSTDNPRMADPTRDRLMCWTRSGYFVPVFFDPSQEGWTIDSQRVPGIRYWNSPGETVDWLTGDVTTPSATTLQQFPIDSQLVHGIRYWTSPWTGNEWATNVVDALAAFDPAKENWTIPTNTYKRRGWWSDSPQPQAWMVPSVIFDKALWPSIAIQSHRRWPKATGRWQPDLDNAWQEANPVIPNTFNPSFATEANTLQDEGGSPIEGH